MTKKLMMLLAALAAALCARAEKRWTDPDTGYTWTYRLNGGTAEILGLREGSYVVHYYSGITPDPSGHVTVPSAIEGVPVTKIGWYAFFNCRGMTSLTIPDSVTGIDSHAFEECGNSLFDIVAKPGLKLVDGWVMGTTDSLSGDLNLTGVRGIGDYAFYNCSGLTSVTIPDSATGIGDYAFGNCSGLTSVTIPESVKKIGYRAFFGCTGLTAVHIADLAAWCGISFREPSFAPYNLYIGGSAVTNLTIPAGITRINDYAFSGCSGITSLTMHDDVTYIGSKAFSGCRGLTDVTISKSVTSVGSGAFAGCAGLKEMTLPFIGKSRDGESTGWKGSMLLFGWLFDSSEFEGGVRITQHYATSGGFTSDTDWFPGALKIVRVTDADGIGYGAFNGCSMLTNIVIPETVTNISPRAFSYCSGLTSVLLPKRFDGNLDESVFVGCSEDMVVSYYDPPYTIVFHRNDASDEKTAAYDFDYGVETHLPSLAKLGWARKGCDFLGWATSRANADAGKVWKKDWAAVSTAVAAGQTLDVYAVWALKPGSYAIQFIRNDGAGTWRTVGFNYGEKTRMPSLANGLGWARRGYDFKGWALTTADANAGKVWKEDWAYVATPVKAGEVLTVYAVWALKPGYYQIRFNKNDGTGKWRTLGFECDKTTKLSTIAGLGWERPDYTFRGWASNKANADAGKVWKPDGEWVTNAAAEGKTLSIYAIWE